MLRKNGAKYCPNRGTHNVTYNAVILDKGDKSRAVRSYAAVTRENVKTPLAQNRLIVYLIISFIKVYLHLVTP